MRFQVSCAVWLVPATQADVRSDEWATVAVIKRSLSCHEGFCSCCVRSRSAIWWPIARQSALIRLQAGSPATSFIWLSNFSAGLKTHLLRCRPILETPCPLKYRRPLRSLNLQAFPSPIDVDTNISTRTHLCKPGQRASRGIEFG